MLDCRRLWRKSHILSVLNTLQEGRIQKFTKNQP